MICEKPLAPGLPDAESISEAVRRSAIVFEACHQYHFSPQWQAVKRLLLGLGRIYLAEYEVHRTEANEGNPHWSPAWRTDRAFAGGGILVDHGAHIFYQLRSVLGDPRTVQATVRTLQHNYRVEDTALVVLDFGACLAQVRLTWAARRRQIRFRFVGERGELVGDDESVRIHADTSQEIRFADGMSRNSSHSEWYSPLFLRFTERVRRQDLDPAPLDEAVYVTRLISRAYESSLEGRTLPFISPPRSWKRPRRRWWPRWARDPTASARTAGPRWSGAGACGSSARGSPRPCWAPGRGPSTTWGGRTSAAR